MTGKFFTANALGAQVRRGVGRFLSKQLPGLRTLFTQDRAETQRRSEDSEERGSLRANVDIYLQIKFLSNF